jgi:Carboxypeptidase regulatory-like domain
MRILTALAALAVPLMACEIRSLTACELLQMPTIFIGEVISGGVTIQEDPWNARARRVRFRVLENFRGLPSDARTVDVEVDGTAGMCAPIPFYAGGRYLVVPNRRDDGKLHEGSQSRDIEKAADDVRVVRAYFAGQMPANVHGRIAVTRHHNDLIDFLLSRAEAKPLAGVRVWASRDGKIQSTNTDAEGRYTLNLPAGGAYQVHASLEPYVPQEPPVRISVPERGCAVQNFAMGIDNTISGRVMNNGQPLQLGQVGLIDLDHPNSSPDSHVWFDKEYPEHDLTYEFENVPIGRYLLMFNPLGPHPETQFDLPFESTFYPAKSTRSAAKVIEFKSGGVHLTGMNLVAGEHVEFRQVTVRVRFPNGKPMQTALVRCIGLPLKEGEPSWMTTESTFQKKNGTVQLFAPSNRKLRIEIQDEYGRKLKESYTAAHEPGSSPITQEFVVKP